MTTHRTPTRALKGTEGFTLVELLVTLLLMTVLLALAATALRQFWRVQSLEGGQDELSTELRGLQARVVSESHPLVYGAAFKVGSSGWINVQYNPETGACTRVRSSDFDGGEFSGGVVVKSLGFEGYSAGSPLVDVTGLCSDAGSGGWTDVVFFFARGSATRGSVTIEHTSLGREKTVCVNGVTSRVDALDELGGASCPS
jgi:prepilin-type N-terminal cleavage/methylation domain-containing protein